MLCLVTSILALLLSVEPYGAVLPWLVGALIAGLSICERIRLRRMVKRRGGITPVAPPYLCSLVQG